MHIIYNFILVLSSATEKNNSTTIGWISHGYQFFKYVCFNTGILFLSLNF